MKSFVFYEITEKKYFLAWSDYTWGDNELSVDSHLNRSGHVGYKESHIQWEVLFDTDDFIRELTTNDSIHFEGKDYKIKTVSHANDGSILYYINKKVVNEDVESKVNAEADLAARKIILQERELERERIKQDEINKAIDELNLKPKKKWYQFWL